MNFAAAQASRAGLRALSLKDNSVGALFSTQDVAAQERFDYWHEVVYRAYAVCEGRVNASSSFSARTSVHDFGPTQFSDVVSGAIRYERRSSDLRKGPRDDIFIALIMDGECYFEQNDTRLIQKPGDVLIYDAAKPYCLEVKAEYRSVLLRIPRPLVQSRDIGLDRIGGTVLRGGSVFGSLIHSLLRETQQIAASDQFSEASDLSGPMLDMIAAAIRRGAGGDPVGGSTHHLLLERIKHYLRKSLADDGLTLERIANEQNVSVRTLGRLFAEAGTTPMGWLQSQRLASAYGALVERKVSSVTEAAFGAGFNDLSNFGRSFKKAYGHTPNSLLK